MSAFIVESNSAEETCQCQPRASACNECMPCGNRFYAFCHLEVLSFSVAPKFFIKAL